MITISIYSTTEAEANESNFKFNEALIGSPDFKNNETIVTPVRPGDYDEYVFDVIIGASNKERRIQIVDPHRIVAE